MEVTTEEDPSMIIDESSINSNEISSSDIASPANRSTEIKKKENLSTGRRISSRAKSKPDFFDASPILPSAAKGKNTTVKPSPLLASPALTENTIDSEKDVTLTGESQELDSDDEALAVFKKPLPGARKRQNKKTSLDVTVKKTKPSNSRANKSSKKNPSLFEIVKEGKCALMSIINDWIEGYQKDKMTAMVELIQFFIHSSGCNAQVNKSMLEAEDQRFAIRHLTENFGEQAEEYPLTITRPEFKKFKSYFVNFIIQLINLSQHSIIYDDEMMDILICWITALSDSQVRAFRHTSTLAGMKIVTGLIDVALKVEVEMDHMQRQLDSESQKTASKKSREKIEKLKRRREELNQNKNELEDMMKRIVSAVFMHRYRDVRPEIRIVCISEMGHWIVKYSSYFLDQDYLKYFGWTLYDKVGDVRLAVLNALEELYQNEDFLDKLELFTGRFQSRMINMTLDSDYVVAVKAIKLATLLYKYDVLQEDDCSQVEQLVFCDHRGMAHAAGEFLVLRIIRLSLAASPKKLKKGSKETYLQQMNVKAILEFFIKTEIHDHCSYLVDSLWDHTDILKDWRTFTNLLLHKNSLIELEDQEESALINLMCCACRQASIGNGPPGRAVKKPSNKTMKTAQDDRLDLSTHFMECLPELVEKYKADVGKVKELLAIPQYFDLELYAEKRLTTQLEALLEHLEDIVMKHADEELLDVCSATYHYLKDNDLVIQQTVEISCNRLLDSIFEKFKKSIAHGIPAEGTDRDTQGYFNIVTSLKRILAFSKDHDVSDYDIHQDLHTIIEQGASGSADDEILKLALNTMLQVFLQNLCSLDSEEPDKAEVKKLRKWQKTFVKQMDDLLQFGDVSLKTEVFKIFCDLFMFFPKQLLNEEKKFGNVVIQPDAGLQVRMRDFIINHVFSDIQEDDDDETEEDDTKVQQLHSKRVLLTGLCRLIANEIFDIKLAAPIYAQFLRGYADYSDIIKYLMHKSKENDIIKFSKVLLFSLQQVFESLREDGEGAIEPKSQDFISIKDLARRFACLLGVNNNLDNVRKSSIIIHREGINYAFSYPVDGREEQVVPDVPPNLIFLEVLHEFICKIAKIDRKVVIKHLNDIAGNLLTKTGRDWLPLKTYRASLESVNDTVVSDVAEKELQEAMALERKEKEKSKDKSISFQEKKTPANKKKNTNAKKKLSLTREGGSNKWLAKKKATEESDEDEAPLSKVAKGIPKLNKSKEINDSGESDIDFHKSFGGKTSAASAKRGSTSKEPVQLGSSKENEEENDEEGEEEEEEEEESDINSSIADDEEETSSKIDTSSQKRKTSSKIDTSSQKRKNLDDSNQGVPELNISSRSSRAAKRRKRDENTSDVSDD